MDEDKLIILVQGHECLYNLQHKHYDNNLVTDNCWKEIAGEWQGSGRVVAGWWQGGGRVVAGWWQGNGMLCVNRPLVSYSTRLYFLPT
jgi:hypothetical protein